MQVLCFTTSYRRPKMLRGCIMDILNQTYPHIAHGINFAYNPKDSHRDLPVIVDDLMRNERVKIVFNENAHQHTNHIRAIQAAQNYTDFDLYVKVDDDEIYKENYVKSIVEFMQKHNCDITSSRVTWQLNGFNLFRVNQSNLGANPEGSDFNMPPTFAFNRKALESLLPLCEDNTWEDLLWRQTWLDSGLKHLSIDNSEEVIWHIHGNNVSTGAFLKQGLLSIRQHATEFERCYRETGGHVRILNKVWVWQGNTLVIDINYQQYRITFDVKFDLENSKVVGTVFDRNGQLIIQLKGKKHHLTHISRHTFIIYPTNDNSLHEAIIFAIDEFLSEVIHQIPEIDGSKLIE